ncbi:hypothetical protein AVEN_226456-1 [Araneus ventricosus]|uniref:Uncharacterized protein n=1 Tax=Araneus ventricosus TaxID=182803 RepID=A0A4Y2NV56_ARAVE|nr:hypothetical protein AVEN_226456-1 [Araneus ventricosus]
MFKVEQHTTTRDPSAILFILCPTGRDVPWNHLDKSGPLPLFTDIKKIPVLFRFYISSLKSQNGCQVCRQGRGQWLHTSDIPIPTPVEFSSQPED